MTDSSGGVEAITFANGRRALAIHAAPSDPPPALLARLGIPKPKSVLVVIGSADDLDGSVVPRLAQLFSAGLLRAATEAGAVLIDGGTESGVMAALGRAVAERDPRPTLIGVAPQGCVTYPGGPEADAGKSPLDPNHSHFVLREGTCWGDETELLFGLADELGREVPAVAVLAAGGSVTRNEVLEVTRRRWPLIVLAGTGGLADAIATADATGEAEDPVLAGIVAEHGYELLSADTDAHALGRLLLRRLQRDRSLELAWQQYAELDVNAVRHQTRFRRLQTSILVLGVVATFLAVLKTTLHARGGPSPWDDRALHYSILVVSIAASVLVAAAARFGAASKWISLRAAAEAIKREIYRYRARVGIYCTAADATTPREVKLANRVGTITRGVMRTDAGSSALAPYDGQLPPPGSVETGDGGFRPLTSTEYLVLRLGDQMQWYRRASVRLERKIRSVRWIMLGVGGAGTFLAAVRLELWIAVTTAVVTALATHLEYVQAEKTLMHYNQAAADLETVHRWWVALPPEEQLRQANIDQLVEQSEAVMSTEQAGWIQDMLDALAELRRRQADDEQLGGTGGRHAVGGAWMPAPTVSLSGPAFDESLRLRAE